MTLLELVNRIDGAEDEACIYAKRPWNRTAFAVIAPELPNGGTPPEIVALQCEYFLEVAIAQTLLSDLRRAADDRISVEALCDRLIHYAIHDA